MEPSLTARASLSPPVPAAIMIAAMQSDTLHDERSTDCYTYYRARHSIFHWQIIRYLLQQLSGKFREWIQHQYLIFPAMVNYWGG